MGFTHLNHLQDPWWERQPDESLTAYTRFCRWRDHDPAAVDEHGQRSAFAVVGDVQFGRVHARPELRSRRDTRPVILAGSGHVLLGTCTVPSRSESIVVVHHDLSFLLVETPSG